MPLILPKLVASRSVDTSKVDIVTLNVAVVDTAPADTNHAIAAGPIEVDIAMVDIDMHTPRAYVHWSDLNQQLHVYFKPYKRNAYFILILSANCAFDRRRS